MVGKNRIGIGETQSGKMTRRGFTRGLLATSLAPAALLGGCSTSSDMQFAQFAPQLRARMIERDPTREFIADYRSRRDGGFTLPEIPVEKIDKQFLRQRVEYASGQRPGTLVVDVPNRFLYLIEPGDQAIRYGVGVGRAGFAWAGNANVGMKREWPTWTPPAPMIRRQPELARYSAANGGMAPGLDNPLGARALYLFRNGRDTLYRLHGTPQWNSIGRAVSSGCIRLINQDIIDLYSRVGVGARVIVRQ